MSHWAQLLTCIFSNSAKHNFFLGCFLWLDTSQPGSQETNSESNMQELLSAWREEK
jgi:hypothetical protein